MGHVIERWHQGALILDKEFKSNLPRHLFTSLSSWHASRIFISDIGSQETLLNARSDIRFEVFRQAKSYLLHVRTQAVVINVRLADAVVCKLFSRQDRINYLVDFPLLEIHLCGYSAEDLTGLFLIYYSDTIVTDLINR